MCVREGGSLGLFLPKIALLQAHCFQAFQAPTEINPVTLKEPRSQTQKMMKL